MDMSVDSTFTIGGGDGRVVKLLQNSTVVAAVDLSGATASNTFYNTSADINTSNNISSYTGTTRNFSDYGYITSPATKYSSTPKTYSFTDNNPTQGFVIQHNQATF